MSSVLLLVILLLGCRLAAELILAALNRAEVRRHAQAPPPSAAAIMEPTTYTRAVAYTLDRSRFGDLTTVLDAVVLVAVLGSGVLPWLFLEVSAWGGTGQNWSRALFIVLAAGLLSLPSLPLEWWEQFRIEARHGFNRSTPGLWVMDRLKGLLLLFLIGLPLSWGLLVLVERLGDSWWVGGFVFIFGFQLLLLVLYPKLILPLFNRLTPLPEGELRDRLLALGDRTGFRARTIEVIDGSKRSGHSNAFFTGFGRFRRIVLFDTLIAQLAPEELEAVLAHEIGHYRRGHIPRMMAFSAVTLLLGFAALAWLARSPWFNEAFGFPTGEMAASLVLCGLLGGMVTFWFSPLAHLLSRRHEYEADAFAREAIGGAGPMIGALRKLAQKNLTNLTPHPWFSGFYYSHPTLVERERALVRA